MADERRYALARFALLAFLTVILGIFIYSTLNQTAVFSLPLRSFGLAAFVKLESSSIRGSISPTRIEVVGETQEVTFTVNYTGLNANAKYKYQFEIDIPPPYDNIRIIDNKYCTFNSLRRVIECGKAAQIQQISSFSLSFYAARHNSLLGALSPSEKWRTTATETVRRNSDETTIDFMVEIADVTKPEVKSTTPSSDAKGVQLNSPITVVFSEAMNRASAEAAFSISPSIGGSFSWSESSDSMTFTPAQNFSEGTTYSATLLKSAEDLAGNMLKNDYRWSFSILSGPPEVELLKPADNAQLWSSSVTFEYTASDKESGIDRCLLIYDGVEKAIAYSQGAAAQSFAKESVSEGSHEWNIKCFDGASNSGQGQLRSFTVKNDKTAPRLVSYSPQGQTPEEKPLVRAVMSDAESGINIDALKMKLQGTSLEGTSLEITEFYTNAESPLDDVEVYILPPQLAPGKYYAAAYFEDNAGNKYCSNLPACDNAGWLYWEFEVTQPAVQPPENKLPGAVLSADRSSGVLTAAGFEINFSFECMDSDGSIASCTLDFGDGSAAQELGPGSTAADGAGLVQGTAPHNYVSAGEFTATLTAVDDRGASAKKATNIIISAAPQPIEPQSRIVQPPAGASVYAGEALRAEGECSDDSAVTKCYWGIGTGCSIQEEQLDGLASKYARIVSTISCSKPDVYELKLHAIDDAELSDSTPAFMRINVLEAQPPPPEEEPNLPPQISGLRAEPLEANEGSSITFIAEARDPDGDALSYLWDFGDGDRTEIDENSIKHNYYLEPGEAERSFTVKLQLSDGEFTVSEQIFVTVRKAYFVIKLLEPISGSSTPLEKNTPVQVRIKIVDATNTPLGGLAPRAMLQDNVIQLSESTSMRGTYSGEFRSSKFTKAVDYLFVEASAEIAGESREAASEFPLYFAPLEISLNNPFEGRTYYQGDRIGRLELRPTYLDDTPVDSAEIDAWLLNGGRKAVSFTGKGSGVYEADINHIIWGNENPVLQLAVRDSFGNRTLLENGFAVPVGLENPLFNISIISPNLALGNIFAYGQPLHLVVSVESVQKPYLGDVTVSLQNFFTGEFELERNSGNYVLSHTLPKMEDYPKNTISLKIAAAGMIEGKHYYDAEIINLALTEQIDVNFLYPSEGTSFLGTEERNKIIVRITYPNGEPVDANALEAAFFDNNESSVIRLVKTERGFEAKLGYELEPGEHTFELRLEEEGYKGSGGKIISVLLNPLDMGQILLFIAALFAIFLAIYFTRAVLSERAKTKKELEMERTNLMGLSKRLRYEYYKRHISEQEYKERLLKTQQKLATVEDMLGLGAKGQKIRMTASEKQKLVSEIKRETSSKIKASSASTGIGREQGIMHCFKRMMDSIMRAPVDEELGRNLSESEREDVRRLVFLLREHKGKYSREEMTKAILAEGYTPRIAEKVIEILFKNH